MKISASIITRNRRDDLRNTIRAFQRQSYTDKEIIIVDNGSLDGTKEMMSEEFPEIQYLWLPDNYNIPALNIAVGMSTGDIIWRCDDDSYPESEYTFETIACLFEKYPDIDIIATEDIEVKNNYSVGDWYHGDADKTNVPQNGYKSNTFHGTGAAIRKKVFDTIGGFWEFGFEELDFSTRAILAGYKIRYFPNIRTLHFSSPGNRKNADRWVQISRQLIRYNWKYFPGMRAFGRFLFLYFFQLMLGLITRQPISALIQCALTMLEVVFPTVRNERIIISKEKMYDITLGVSIIKTQTKYLRQAISNKLSGLRK